MLVLQAVRDPFCSMQDYYNMQIRLPAYYIRGKLNPQYALCKRMSIGHISGYNCGFINMTKKTNLQGN